MKIEPDNVFIRIALRTALCILLAPLILGLLLLIIPLAILFMIAYLFIPSLGRYGSFLRFRQSGFHWKKSAAHPANGASSGGTPPADAADGGGIDVECKVLRSEIVDEPDNTKK